MANNVYDPETDPLEDEYGPAIYDSPTAPGTRSYNRQNLQNAESGGGMSNQAGLSPGGAASPTADAGKRGSGAASPDSLKNSEESGNDLLGKGYNPKAKYGLKARLNYAGNYAKGNPMKIMFGGFFGGGFISVFVMLMMLIPLKIEHMISNLQDRFFSSATQAVSDTTQHLMENYIVKHVIPDYRKCGTTLSRECRVSIPAGPDSPVRNLYHSWAHNRLEYKLARKGIFFEHRADGHFYMKAPGIEGGVGIGKNGETLHDEFKKANRKKALDAATDALAEDSRWPRSMLRYKAGRLLAVKYGEKRFIFFNGTRHEIHNTKKELEHSFKIFLTQRVLEPRNQTLAIALECLFTNCDAVKSEPTDPADAAEQNGFPENTETDGKMRKTLDQLATKYGATNLTEILAKHDKIQERGFQKYISDSLLKKVPFVDEALAQSTTDKIPIIGWINLTAQVVNAANDAGPNIRKLSYAVNAAAAVSLYMNYRTYSDEIHTGEVQAEAVGSWTDSLSPGDPKDTKDRVGGMASAEEAPLYDALITGKSAGVSTTASLLSSVLPAKAYAATSNESSSSSNFLCNNNKPVPINSFVCPEEILAGGVGIANAAHDFINSDGGVLVGIAQAWRGTVGRIGDFLGGVFGEAMQLAAKPFDLQCKISGLIPGHIIEYSTPVVGQYCAAKDAIPKLTELITKGITTALIPSPFSTNMSGGRIFQMAAAGADVAGNQFAQIGLGAQKISDTFSADIINRQKQEAQERFNRQPFYARMFDTESSYSLVSRMAMATPLSMRTAAVSNFAGIISNPVNTLASGFGSMFTGKTSAAKVPSKDPFGIPQYGYPTSGSGSIPDDPEEYWDKHCDEKPEHGYQNDVDYAAHPWNKEAADNIDSETQLPTNKTTNPCLLIKTTVGSVGAKYDANLLTEEDKAEIGDSSGSGSEAAGGSLPTGSAKDLAAKLKPFVDNGKIKCLNSGCPDIVDTADGKSIQKASCNVGSLDPAILGMLLNLVQNDHTFILSAMCTDHPSNPASLHHQGKAVDFNTIDGVFMGPSDTSWDGKKLAAGRKLDEDIASFMPESTGFGQIQCHPKFDFLSKFNTFGDACHHQHVQVK